MQNKIYLRPRFLPHWTLPCWGIVSDFDNTDRATRYVALNTINHISERFLPMELKSEIRLEKWYKCFCSENFNDCRSFFPLCRMISEAQDTQLSHTWGSGQETGPYPEYQDCELWDVHTAELWTDPGLTSALLIPMTHQPTSPAPSLLLKNLCYYLQMVILCLQKHYHLKAKVHLLIWRSFCWPIFLLTLHRQHNLQPGETGEDDQHTNSKHNANHPRPDHLSSISVSTAVHYFK